MGTGKKQEKKTALVCNRPPVALPRRHVVSSCPAGIFLVLLVGLVLATIAYVFKMEAKVVTEGRTSGARAGGGKGKGVRRRLSQTVPPFLLHPPLFRW